MAGICPTLPPGGTEKSKIVAATLVVAGETMTFLKITLQTILCVFLISAVFLVLTSKRPVFGFQSMVVLTGSMEPTISVGSIVFVKGASQYQKGDIITFKNTNGNHVTHRLVEMVSDNGTEKYRLKGDANQDADTGLVDKKDIVGKTLFYVPYIGKLSQLLKTPVGFIGLIVVPALAFIGYELRNIKREIERVTEKKVLEKMKLEKAE